MKKIGISTYELQSIFGDKGAIDVALQVGADAIDFFTNQYSVSAPDTIFSKSDEEIVEYFENIRLYAESKNIEIAQTHGRTRIFHNDAEQDRECLENARRDLLAASVLGAPVCVMHGVKSTTVGCPEDTSPLFDINYEKFNIILEWAKKYNVKVATETSGFSSAFGVPEFDADSENFKKLFEDVKKDSQNGEYFVVCIDTGHTNTVVRFGNSTVGDTIRMFGNNVSCLHLHDNDGLTDQHLPLFMGNIDWDDTFAALEEIGYMGVYNLEVNFACMGEEKVIETAVSAVNTLRSALKKREK